MKHPLRALTLPALLFSISVVPVASAQLSFTDNFNSGASALWGNQRGNWVASNGRYYASNPGNDPPTFSLLPFDLTDFSIWVDVANLQDGGIWLRSRMNAQANTISDGVLLVTGGQLGRGTGLYWHTITNGAYSTVLNEVTGLFRPGLDNARIRVDVTGNTFAAYVGNNVNPATTLSLAPGQFADGFTGLYDFSAQTFGNVTVVGQTVVAVPEPATLALIAPGLLGLLIRRRRPS